jgi:hypothetical protein
MTRHIKKLSEIDNRPRRCEIMPRADWAHSIGLAFGAAILASIAATGSAGASSHMDAPLVVLEPAANTTDVYAFLSEHSGSSEKYLTTALAVYPFEEPGIGPNLYLR